MMVQFCLVAKDSDFSKAITESKPDRHWSFDSFLPAKNVEASSGPTSTEYPAFGKVNSAVKMKNGGRIESSPTPGMIRSSTLATGTKLPWKPWFIWTNCVIRPPF